jgi:citrate lyase subunit gamma (acyl carrier protein)
MEIKAAAIAGTLESGDIMITLEPGAGKIEIDLQSTVEKQFGREIRALILDTLEELGIRDARIKAVDRGALNCAIRARVKTAACRSAGTGAFSWGVRK